MIFVKRQNGATHCHRQTGQTGQKQLAFKLEFPGNLWEAAFAIPAMFCALEIRNAFKSRNMWQLFIKKERLWQLQIQHLMMQVLPSATFVYYSVAAKKMMNKYICIGQPIILYPVWGK